MHRLGSVPRTGSTILAEHGRPSRCVQRHPVLLATSSPRAAGTPAGLTRKEMRPTTTAGTPEKPASTTSRGRSYRCRTTWASLGFPSPLRCSSWGQLASAGGRVLRGAVECECRSIRGPVRVSVRRSATSVPLMPERSAVRSARSSVAGVEASGRHRRPAGGVRFGTRHGGGTALGARTSSPPTRRRTRSQGAAPLLPRRPQSAIAGTCAIVATASAPGRSGMVRHLRWGPLGV